MWPYIWGISYVSKMYRNKIFENQYFSVRKVFWRRLHNWNFFSFLTHLKAPFLLVDLSIICLRSHVGAPELKNLKSAKITKFASRTPTCDRRQIIENWTSKNGALGRIEKTVKVSVMYSKWKNFPDQKIVIFENFLPVHFWDITYVP